MKIMIIGTSRITSSHIQVLKRRKIDIIGISSTRNKSKNLKKLSKKFLIKKKFTNCKKAIDYATRIQDCNFLITSRIEDNLKILKYCMQTKRYIFIEKPIFLESKTFNKILNYKNKLFIGYNRLFYKTIEILKKKLKKKKFLNIIVKCPEENNIDVLKNSCHVISILIYLFGNLKLIKKDKRKNFISCSLIGRKGVKISIFFNFKNSDNFSIEIFDKKVRYLLSPLEKLKIYKKLKIIKQNNNFLYIPKIFLSYDEHQQNKFKPGFDKQINKFISFCKGKKIINNVEFGKDVIRTCEKLC